MSGETFEERTDRRLDHIEQQVERIAAGAERIAHLEGRMAERDRRPRRTGPPRVFHDADTQMAGNLLRALMRIDVADRDAYRARVDAIADEMMETARAQRGEQP